MAKSKDRYMIGWVVAWRVPDSKEQWEAFDNSVAWSRSEAIANFNARCQFYFLRRATIDKKHQFRALYKRGLAFTVPVYMEVKP